MKIIKIILFLIALLLIGVIIFFGHRDIPIEKLKAKYTNAASSFIAVNGMDVHYRDEGNKADSIPIVLIHGTGSSLHTFDGWVDKLIESNRVIRMDLPGYGLTGPFPNRSYSMANYTNFMKDFLMALGIKQCILAGNSLGGQIAWNMALRHSDMVQKLILIDAAGIPKNSKSIPIAFKLAEIPFVNRIFTYITPKFVVRSSVENVFFDKSNVTDSLVDRYFELSLRKGNRQAFVDRFNIPSDSSTYKRINEVNQPTLILWGADDLLIPLENAYKFQTYLPNDTLVILNKTGHTPMEESPVESLKPVLDFLKIKQ